MTRRIAIQLPALSAILLLALGGCGGSESGPANEEGASGTPGIGGNEAVGGGFTQQSGGATSPTSGGTVGLGGAAPGAGGVNPGAGGVTAGLGGAVVGTGGGGLGGASVGAGGSSPGTGGSLPGQGGSSPGVGGEAVGTGGAEPGAGGSLVGVGGAAPEGGAENGSGGMVVGNGGQLGFGGEQPGTGGADLGSGGTVDPSGGAGQGGATGVGGATEVEPSCTLPPPSDFELNLEVGGGGADYVESDHFLVFGAEDPARVINFMEAAHQCFVEDWCWRSPGLSIRTGDDTFYKFNIYAIANLSAGGYMGYDGGAGLSYIQVLLGLEDVPSVTVHEFGHALTLTAEGWVDQSNTGFWWESVANFVADTFITHELCEPARSAAGLTVGNSIIELDRTISNAHWAICMNQNYYQAWPFLTYLTNNPDGYSGLGKMILPDLFEYHLRNNETPLHVLERLAAPVSVQTILGRYWARMAYLDIEHPRAQSAFMDARARLEFTNLSSVSDGVYQVLPSRRPQYGGANIIPLTVTSGGEVSVTVTNRGNGQDDSNFTATLSIRASDGTVRYVDLPAGTGTASIAAGEEVSLVVVNTPDVLYMYNPQDIGTDETSEPASVGLDYQVELVGAAPRDLG